MHRLAAAAALWVCLAAAERPSISILRTGRFHGEEIKARTGQRWLGLVADGGRFEWRMLTIAVRAVEDPIVDEPGQQTGKEVDMAGVQPVVLLRGAGWLLKTKVTGAAVMPNPHVFQDNSEVKLTCSACGGDYTLRLLNRKANDDAPAAPSKLVLAGRGVTQTLFEWPEGFSDQSCEIIWAGDMDGDGRLDLLIDLSDHYNVSDVMLLLSSHRPAGKLVGLSASLRTKGC